MTRRSAFRTVIPRYTDDGSAIAGLPGRCFAITNSERNDAACPAAYRFRHVDGLRPDTVSSPLRYGTAWHTVAEAVFTHWRDNDGAPVPDGFVSGVINTIAAGWFADGVDPTDAEPAIERLRRGWHGWFVTHGDTPPDGYDVVAVEHPLAAPIVDGRGGVYTPEMYVTTDDGGATWRPCRTAETHTDANVRRWRLPWWQVGRVDAVLRHRNTGALWIWDHKTASNPSGFLASVTVDPQSHGYAWLLAYNVAAGLFGDDPNARIGGFVFDVVSNRDQYDPKVLKSGALSLDMRRTVPSWRFAAAVDSLGLDPAKYADHVAELARTHDRKLYQRDWLTVGATDRVRYGVEIHATARRLASMRRNAARAANNLDVFAALPRVPVCRSSMYGCSYRAPCLADGADVRRSFIVSPGLEWHDDTRSPAESDDHATTPTTNHGEFGW